MARKASDPVVATSTTKAGSAGVQKSNGGKDVQYLGYGK